MPSPIRLLVSAGTAETNKQVRCGLRWLAYHSAEHLLTKSAPRVPEEHHGVLAPEAGQVEGLALEIPELDRRSRLSDLVAHRYGLLGVLTIVSVDFPAVGAKLPLGRWLHQ